MKQVILITGDLAAGKTTFASILSKRLNIPFFYKDKIKEILADNTGYQNREENKKMSFATFDILLEISKQLINPSKSFIIESNFRQSELDQLKELFQSNNYSIVTIVLSGDVDKLYERYVYRYSFLKRHVCHYFFESKSEFVKYVEESRDREYYGKVVRIYADDFEYQSDDKISLLLNELKKD